MPTDADGCRRMPTDADGCRRIAEGLPAERRGIADGLPTDCRRIADGLPTDCRRIADGCRRMPTDADGHRRTPTDTDGHRRQKADGWICHVSSLELVYKGLRPPEFSQISLEHSLSLTCELSPLLPCFL